MLATAHPEPNFAALRAENERSQTENAHLSTEVKRLSALVEKLTFQLAMLRRMQFGPKSEASAHMDDLFGTPTELEQPAAPPKAPPHKASREPKAAPRVTLPPNLPVDVVQIDLPEADKHDAQGNPLRRIGEEVSDRLAVTPGRFFIRRTVRPKYADPALPENGVRCAPLPARVIDGGLLDESVLADIAIRKFDDHLPLHRIGEIYYRDRASRVAATRRRSEHSERCCDSSRRRCRPGQADIERCRAGLRRLAGAAACRGAGCAQG